MDRLRKRCCCDTCPGAPFQGLVAALPGGGRVVRPPPAGDCVDRSSLPLLTSCSLFSNFDGWAGWARQGGLRLGEQAGWVSPPLPLSSVVFLPSLSGTAIRPGLWPGNSKTLALGGNQCKRLPFSYGDGGQHSPDRVCLFSLPPCAYR